MVNFSPYNLSCITSFVERVFDNNNQVDVVYLNFSKAFDSIDHSILFKKFDNINIDPNLIKIMNYLSDRSHRVSVGLFLL